MIKTVLTLVLIASAVPAATIARRQVNQQARIVHNARAGELTRAETVRVERHQAALAREVRHDRIDGGGLTVAERAKINHQQNALSREINRLSHNGRVR